jgi:hypothetical protein
MKSQENGQTFQLVNFKKVTACLCALCLMLLAVPQTCLAYVGPGSGITALGAILAVIGTVLVVILGFILWPIRYLIRMIKKKRAEKNPKAPSDK